MDGRADRRLRQRRVSAGLKRREALSASDLLRHEPGIVRVSGRVVSCEGSGAHLADAFGLLRVTATRPLGLEPGELVVMSGRWTGRALERARVEARFSAPTPRGDGDIARFVFEGVGANLRARSRALGVIREYFAEQDFIEVETPLLVRAPGVDRNVEALAAGSAYLITTPELAMKRLLVGGVPRLFQLDRVFRRDESGALHQPEFTLLEWYRAFAGYEQVIADTEQIVSRVAGALAGGPRLTAPDGRLIAVRPPFERVRVADAFREYAGISDVSRLARRNEDRYFELLVDKVEPALAARRGAVFLCDYPISQAALARPCPEDPRFAERFELYAGGVELSNGYGELTDPHEQRRRFLLEEKRRRGAGRNVYPIDQQFLDALAAGMPPSSGNALGLDRLVALSLGRPQIADVVAFPWQGKLPG
jgi:lysyl-tRNA synthetase class 2